MRRNNIDKIFLIIVGFLVLGGFFVFISASLGLYARDGSGFGAVALNQAFFGLFLGGLALVLFSKINYKIWKRYSLLIFTATLFLTVLVFAPVIGLEHGGATRWLKIGAFSFQPSELLKLGVIIYLAAWFSSVKHQVRTIKWGLLPLVIVLVLSGAILLAQPDTGTFLTILATATAMFLIAGGKWKHFFSLVAVAISGFIVLIFTRSYILERIYTFMDPSRDPSGAGWQIQQSLIAIGSGGIFGKGFGQSIQKFSFLPEPIGDSIFAVASEEFGFIGAILIITAFLAFLIRGLQIARRSPDMFSGLLVSGIVIMVVFQSFINIASILGVFPLTGLPLIFISHGSSALLTTLAAVGIILNISRYKKVL